MDLSNRSPGFRTRFFPENPPIVTFYGGKSKAKGFVGGAPSVHKAPQMVGSNQNMTNTKILSVLSAVVALLCHETHAQVFLVDAPGGLSAVAVQVKASAPGGVKRIRFKTYADVGSFTINGLTADSLIFERAAETSEPLVFSGILFQIRGVNAPVVFRNLALKALNGSSVVLDGAASASPNKNLLIDSCQIFGDTLNTPFLTWIGSTGSKVEIRKSIIAALKGVDGKIEVTSDTLRVSNNYMNYSGLFSSTSPRRLEVWNNTTNRIQFEFNGKFTGYYSFQKNILDTLRASIGFPGYRTNLL